jgi:hypothetical protein
MNFLASIRRRLAPFVDKSAVVLALVGLAVMYSLDDATTEVLLRWSLFAMVIGALAIVISRITFPQIKLSEMLSRAKEGNMPAAVVTAALILYCALVFIGIALWAK